MKITSNNFIPAAREALADQDMRRSVNQATTTAYQKRKNLMFEFGVEHGEALRQQAARLPLQSVPLLRLESFARLARAGRNQDD